MILEYVLLQIIQQKTIKTILVKWAGQDDNKNDLYICTDECDKKNYITDDRICTENCNKIIDELRNGTYKYCTSTCPLWTNVTNNGTYCDYGDCNESYYQNIVNEEKQYNFKECIDCNISNYIYPEQNITYSKTYSLCSKDCNSATQYFEFKTETQQYCIKDCTNNSIQIFDGYRVVQEGEQNKRQCYICDFPYAITEDINKQTVCQLCGENQFYANYTIAHSNGTNETIIKQCLDECKYRGTQAIEVKTENGQTNKTEIKMCFGNDYNGQHYINFPLCPNQEKHNTTEEIYQCTNCTSEQYYTIYFKCQAYCWNNNITNNTEFRLFINKIDNGTTTNLTCRDTCNTSWYEIVNASGQIQPNCTYQENCTKEPYHVGIIDSDYSSNLTRCESYCKVNTSQYMDYESRVCQSNRCKYLNTTKENIDNVEQTLYICEEYKSDRCQLIYKEQSEQYICLKDCGEHIKQEDMCVDDCSQGYYINDNECTTDMCTNYYELDKIYKNSLKCLDNCDIKHGIDESLLTTTSNTPERCLDDCYTLPTNKYTDGNQCRSQCDTQPNIFAYNYICYDQCPKDAIYTLYKGVQQPQSHHMCIQSCQDKQQIYINEQLIFCIICNNSEYSSDGTDVSEQSYILYDNQSQIYTCNLLQETQTVQGIEVEENQFYLQNTLCENYANLTQNVIIYYKNKQFTDTIPDVQSDISGDILSGVQSDIQYDMSGDVQRGKQPGRQYCVDKCPIYTDSQLQGCTYQCNQDQIYINIDENITYCQLCSGITNSIYEIIKGDYYTYQSCIQCDNGRYIHSNYECNSTKCSSEATKFYHKEQSEQNNTLCVDNCTDFITNMICEDQCIYDSYIWYQDSNNQQIRQCDQNCPQSKYITPDGQYNNTQQCIDKCTDSYPFINEGQNQCLDKCDEGNENKYYINDNDINVCTTNCELPKIFQNTTIGNINAQICKECDEMLCEIQAEQYYCETTEQCKFYINETHCYGIGEPSERNEEKCEYFTWQDDKQKYLCGPCKTKYIQDNECLGACPSGTFLNITQDDDVLCLQSCDSGWYYSWDKTENSYICQQDCNTPQYHGFDDVITENNQRCEESCTQFQNWENLYIYQGNNTCLPMCPNFYQYYIKTKICEGSCGSIKNTWIIYNQTNYSTPYQCTTECQPELQHKAVLIRNGNDIQNRNYCIECNNDQQILVESTFNLSCINNISCQDRTNYQLEELCIQMDCSSYNSKQTLRKYDDYVYYINNNKKQCFTTCQTDNLFLQYKNQYLCDNSCNNNSITIENSLYICTDCSLEYNNIWKNITIQSISQTVKQCSYCSSDEFVQNETKECTDTCDKFTVIEASDKYKLCVIQCPQQQPFSTQNDTRICSESCSMNAYENKTFYNNDSIYTFCNENCTKFIGINNIIKQIYPCLDSCSNGEYYHIDQEQYNHCQEKCELKYGIDKNVSNITNRCVDDCSEIDQNMLLLDEKQCLDQCPQGYDVKNNKCTLECIKYYDYFSIYCISQCEDKYQLVLDNKSYCADCTKTNNGSILTYKNDSDIKQYYYCKESCEQQKVLNNSEAVLCLEVSCYQYSQWNDSKYKNQYQTDNNICINNCALFINNNQIENNQLYCTETCEQSEYKLDEQDQLRYCVLCENETEKMYFVKEINGTTWHECQYCYSDQQDIYQQLNNECNTSECFLYQTILHNDKPVRQCITKCSDFIINRQCQSTCDKNGYTNKTIEGDEYRYCDENCSGEYQYINNFSYISYNGTPGCVSSCDNYIDNYYCADDCSISYIINDNKKFCDNCTWDDKHGLIYNGSENVLQCIICKEFNQNYYLNRNNQQCINQVDCQFQNITYNICEQPSQNCKYVYQISYTDSFTCTSGCQTQEYQMPLSYLNLTDVAAGGSYLCIQQCDLFINNNRQCLEGCQNTTNYTVSIQNDQTMKTCQQNCDTNQIRQIDDQYSNSLLRCLTYCSEHSTLKYNVSNQCQESCTQEMQFVQDIQSQICIEKCDTNTAYVESLLCLNETECPQDFEKFYVNSVYLCGNCYYGQKISYISNSSDFKLNYVQCSDCGDDYKKIVSTSNSGSNQGDIDYNDVKFCTISTCGFTAKYITDFIDNIVYNDTSYYLYCQDNCTGGQFLNQIYFKDKEYQCVQECENNTFIEQDNKKYCKQCEIYTFTDQGTKNCVDCKQNNEYLYERECNSTECWKKLEVINIIDGINKCLDDCENGIGLRDYTTCDSSCQYVYISYIIGKQRKLCRQDDCDKYFVQIEQQPKICYDNCPIEHQYVDTNQFQCVNQCQNKYYYLTDDFTKKCTDQCEEKYIQMGTQCIICPVFYGNDGCLEKGNIIDYITMKQINECQSKKYQIGSGIYCLNNCSDIQLNLKEYNNQCYYQCPYPTINNNGQCTENVEQCQYIIYENHDRQCVQECQNKYYMSQEFNAKICVISCQSTQYVYEHENECNNNPCNEQQHQQIQNNHIVCTKTCETQITNNICQSCKSNQFKDDNQCVYHCNQKYINNNECVLNCQNGYFYIVGVDKYCIGNCSQDQFMLQTEDNSAKQCIEQCPINKQYYLNRTCQADCQNYKLIKQYQCVQECPEEYYISKLNSSICLQCNQYKQYVINNQCVQCQQQIISFFNNQTDCVQYCDNNNYLYIDNQLSIICTDISCQYASEQSWSLKEFTQKNINNICTKQCEGYLQDGLCVPKCDVYVLEKRECGNCNISQESYTIKYTNIYCTDCKGENYYTIDLYCAQNINCTAFYLLLQQKDDQKQCVKSCDSQMYKEESFEQINKYICIDQCDKQYIIQQGGFESLLCSDQCQYGQYIQIEENQPYKCLDDCQNYVYIYNEGNYQCVTHEQCQQNKFIHFDKSKTYKCDDYCTNREIYYITIEQHQYKQCLDSTKCSSQYYIQEEFDEKPLYICQQQKQKRNICQEDCPNLKIYQKLTVNYECVDECTKELQYILNDNLCQSDCGLYKFSQQIENKSNSYQCQETCDKNYIGDTALAGVYQCLDTCLQLGNLFLYSTKQIVQIGQQQQVMYRCVKYCPYHSFALNFVCSDKCNDEQYVQYNNQQKICQDSCGKYQLYKNQKMLNITYKLCVDDCDNLIIEQQPVNFCSDQEDQPFDWIQYVNDQCKDNIN